MEDFMKSIRDELRKYGNYLENDIEEFNKKLNSTRKYLSDYLDQQIESLINLNNEYNDYFNYLDQENKNTCANNQTQFDRLCLLINRNDNDPVRVSQLLNQFKQNFPLRPKMLESIPKYVCKDFDIKDFITKQEINQNGIEQTTIHSEQILTKQPQFSVHHNQSSFIPIPNLQPVSSIGSSHHKQFASQNNEIDTPPESRLVSTCSAINEVDHMVDISFKIPYYRHDRKSRLLCFNKDEDYFLIYLISSRELEYVSLKTHQIFSINLPISESIKILDYSIDSHLFYMSTRQTSRFILFKLNQQKQIEIEREIYLIDKTDHFISVHIYEYFIFYLYLSSSSIVMFGKYDLEKSSLISSIHFQNKLYDVYEQSSYKILDFAVNDSYISFLTELKKKDKFIIIMYDYDTMDQLHTFDLINAVRPLSIISTQKKSKTTTTMCNNENELSLFVNDLKSHSIHCYTHRKYLTSIRIDAFGICALDDGNLALITNDDIRGLIVQNYLQRNIEEVYYE